MAWEPITGLGDGWEELASRELPPLIAVWSEQRESLLETESLKDFNERLAREWAIETGILEGLYTLDRGITRLLIERGIDESLISHDATDRPPAQVAAHIHDQKDAIDWLFEFVKSERPFSESFIKELHALITRSQDTATGIASGRKVEVPLLRGAYKKWPNNPTRADGSVHDYCHPEQVTVEMERLVEFHDRYSEEGVAPEVFAAWLHHRFVQIHPFQGRKRPRCPGTSFPRVPETGMVPSNNPPRSADRLHRRSRSSRPRKSLTAHRDVRRHPTQGLRECTRNCARGSTSGRAPRSDGGCYR